MNREELIKALRCCTSGPSVADCKDKCAFYKGADMSLCIPEMGRVVSDAMENDQKRLDVLNDYTIQLENQKESLLAENERLKKQRDAAVEDLRVASIEGDMECNWCAGKTDRTRCYNCSFANNWAWNGMEDA